MDAATIVELRVSNFKKIKFVRIRPDGEPLVVIGGDNGAGKSCVLDAIMATLGGKKACPEQPIREGEKGGWVEIDFGEFTGRRTFTPNGGEVTLTDKNTGARFPRPQDAFDALVGPISFDPLEFTREPAKQPAMLQALLGIDLEGLAGQRAELYARRRDVNRQADEAAKLATGYRRQVPDDTPAKPVSVAELIDMLNDTDAQNRAIQSEQIRRDRRSDQVPVLEDRIGDLKRQLADACAELGALRVEVERWEPLPEPVDREPLQARIKAAEPINAAIRRRQQAEEAETAAEVRGTEAAELTGQIEALDTQRVEAIAAAHLPVEGLDFDGASVTYLGVPFSQASSAEQLRVSVALAMAANPKLRIMLIRDGSLLDRSNLELLAEMAMKHEHQVWIERVGVGPETLVVMEDGAVRGAGVAP